MDEHSIDTPDDASPALRLYSPNAAANWSLLFTPIFGAYLHAKNWRAIGDADRADTNIKWMWIGIALLVATVASFFFPSNPTADYVFRAAWVGLLGGWYFALAKPQAKYVKRELAGQYDKRSIWPPILVGLGGWVVYAGVVALSIAVVFVLMRPSADELADEMLPVIAEDVQQIPGLRSARVVDVSLIPISETQYSGTMQIEIDGRVDRVPIQVERRWYGNLWGFK